MVKQSQIFENQSFLVSSEGSSVTPLPEQEAVSSITSDRLTSAEVEMLRGHNEGRSALSGLNMVADVALSAPFVEKPAEEPCLLTQRLSFLRKTVQDVVREKAKAFRKTAVDETKPSASAESPREGVHGESSGQKRKRHKCKVAGQDYTSFELTPEFMEDALNITKFPISEEKKKIQKFSLYQRLENWKMERRRRTEGAYDMYYYHSASGGLFRSVPEVAEFILFEIYPNNQASKPKKLNQRVEELIELQIEKYNESNVRRSLQRLKVEGENNILGPDNDQEHLKVQILENGFKFYKFM